MLRNYIKIARLDHWIKQLFILPGVIFAYFLCKPSEFLPLIEPLLLGFLATCFIASANYIINEYLDREFDQYHPTKKRRPVVSENLNSKLIWLEYALFSAIGFALAWLTSPLVFASIALLWIMGVLYNVRPFRTKEIVYLDVLSESINNAIRLLIGWFIVAPDFLPPASIVFGYWMGGAFLMAVKRFSEYRMINDKKIAAMYRRSFLHYSEKRLLLSAFFYALLSMFFCGIFMIKYRVELLIDIPVLCGLFCVYLNIAYKPDSSAQKPEKLFRERFFMSYIALFIVLSIALMIIDLPFLQSLLETSFIGIEKN